MIPWAIVAGFSKEVKRIAADGLECTFGGGLVPVIVDGLTGSIFWVSLRVRGFHSPQGLSNGVWSSFTKPPSRNVDPVESDTQSSSEGSAAMYAMCTTGSKMQWGWQHTACFQYAARDGIVLT